MHDNHKIYIMKKSIKTFINLHFAQNRFIKVVEMIQQYFTYFQTQYLLHHMYPDLIHFFCFLVFVYFPKGFKSRIN